MLYIYSIYKKILHTNKQISMDSGKLLSEYIHSITEDIESNTILMLSLQKKVDMINEKIKCQATKKQELLEENFHRKYYKTATKVRSDYCILLDEHSYQGGVGYRVVVPGYNKKGAHHWVLRTKAREYCLPSSTVIEAFDIVGQKVYIDDRVHTERWGN